MGLETIDHWTETEPMYIFFCLCFQSWPLKRNRHIEELWKLEWFTVSITILLLLMLILSYITVEPLKVPIYTVSWSDASFSFYLIGKIYGNGVSQSNPTWKLDVKVGWLHITNTKSSNLNNVYAISIMYHLLSFTSPFVVNFSVSHNLLTYYFLPFSFGGW